MRFEVDFLKVIVYEGPIFSDVFFSKSEQFDITGQGRSDCNIIGLTAHRIINKKQVNLSVQLIYLINLSKKLDRNNARETQSVVCATFGHKVMCSIPTPDARSLLVGSVSI